MRPQRMELHRREFDRVASFRYCASVGRDHRLAEVEPRVDRGREAADDDVPRQAAVVDRVEWRGGRTVAGGSRDEERIARVDAGIGELHLAVDDLTALGIGAMARVGSGTTAGIGVPARISASGKAREPAAGRPAASSGVPTSKASWTRHSSHMPWAKCG